MESLTTMLFEDHWLADAQTLREFRLCYVENRKLDAVSLLLRTRTCRMAACLSVAAMEDKYDPHQWTCRSTEDPSLLGLVEEVPGKIDTYKLLLQLKSALQLHG